MACDFTQRATEAFDGNVETIFTIPELAFDNALNDFIHSALTNDQGMTTPIDHSLLVSPNDNLCGLLPSDLSDQFDLSADPWQLNDLSHSGTAVDLDVPRLVTPGAHAVLAKSASQIEGTARGRFSLDVECTDNLEPAQTELGITKWEGKARSVARTAGNGGKWFKLSESLI